MFGSSCCSKNDSVSRKQTKWNPSLLFLHRLLFPVNLLPLLVQFRDAQIERLSRNCRGEQVLYVIHQAHSHGDFLRHVKQQGVIQRLPLNRSNRPDLHPQNELVDVQRVENVLALRVLEDLLNLPFTSPSSSTSSKHFSTRRLPSFKITAQSLMHSRARS